MMKNKKQCPQDCKQSLTTEDFYKAKAALEKASVPTPYISFVSTACTTSAVNWSSFDAPNCCEKKQEGTTPMTNETERNYLNRRIDNVSYDLDQQLRNQFHIGKNTSPKTYKDLIDWIKNDKFTLDVKETKLIDGYVEGDGVYYGSSFDGIIWNGAGFTVDRDAYEAGRKAMKKALQAAKDVINTQDSAAGLKALQDFEAWTYTPPAVAA